MAIITLIAVLGILLVYALDVIPLTGVGGSMVIGFILLAAAPAVGIHEAWTKRRGFVGWVTNILVAWLGAFLLAPLGGIIIGPLFSALGDGRSLAQSGGIAMGGALAAMMLMVIAGAWGAIWVVNRWRD